jgi:hypothetical protein
MVSGAVMLLKSHVPVRQVAGMQAIAYVSRDHVSFGFSHHVSNYFAIISDSMYRSKQIDNLAAPGECTARQR